MLRPVAPWPEPADTSRCRHVCHRLISLWLTDRVPIGQSWRARAWASRRPGRQPVPQAFRPGLALATLLLATTGTNLSVAGQVHRPERQPRLMRPVAESRS